MKCYAYWINNRLCLASLGLLVVSAAWFSGQAHASEYALITDMKGKISIKHEGKKLHADLGKSLSVGDSISLNKNASLVFVSYADCREWQLTGPDVVSIDAKYGPQSKKHSLRPIRTLPVCFNPDEFQDEQAPVIGGLVFRGPPPDPVAGLRREFNSGEVSNAALMTLIMYDLKHDHAERAEPYYDLLKQRIPHSSFIKTVAPRFKP